VIGRPVPLLQDEGDVSTGGLGSSIFAGVYSQCLRSSRPKRQGLLTGMVKLFDAKRAGDVGSWLSTGNGGAAAVVSPNSASSNGAELMDFKASSKRLKDGAETMNKAGEPDNGAAELDLGFLAFVAQTLCNLPYDVQEEPLFVVHLVSRFVAYEGSALLAAFKQKLRAEGFAAEAGLAANEEDDSDDEGLGEVKDSDSSDADEDLVTLKLSPKKPRGRPPSAKPSAAVASSSSKTSASNSSTNGPSKHLRALATSSVAVDMLLRVKHFLKEVYKLASAKCADYTPSEGTKSMERSLHRPEWPLPQLSGLPDAHCLSRFGAGRAQRHGDGDLARPGDAEAVCAQFSAFRRLMRQDPADFKLSTAKSPRSGGGVNKAGKKRTKGNAGTDGEGDNDDEPAVIRDAKAASNGTKKAKKAPLKKKKKKKKAAAGSDESGGDDSDDEDYR